MECTPRSNSDCMILAGQAHFRNPEATALPKAGSKYPNRSYLPKTIDRISDVETTIVVVGSYAIEPHIDSIGELQNRLVFVFEGSAERSSLTQAIKDLLAGAPERAGTQRLLSKKRLDAPKDLSMEEALSGASEWIQSVSAPSNT